ncbi:hypothetical protein F5B22DRAFT_607983 [Xylaria bambusicola]|uniref:uncharacterized protein n=1 Tax=Xylaria bambusicola TaxID=326684 RepID=UPI0020086AEB|nr:uncharacterized protein F5B22DRAFT_607983 [Xylaria bambusicola]KAI0515313.1 hypothetical protein F5B22DRAFT_607983 [Xylaria bambusicola]
MPEFEFVHVGRPGDEKKQSTKIRRHVMKDIGRSRRKPKLCSKMATVKPVPMGTAPSSDSECQVERTLVPSPLNESRLKSIVFPTDMDEERRNLARYVFAEARSSYIPFLLPWLSIGLADAAAWYITLASTRNLKLGKANLKLGTDTETMKWYTLSLQSVSKRLADPSERGKEGLLGAITGIICYETSTGNFSRQAIHLQGLKQLIDDMGGINTITNPMLRLIISWYDLTGAAYRNTLPLFEVPKGSITEIDTRNDSIYFKMLLDSWDRHCPYLGDIQGALLATAAVASYVNMRCRDASFWKEDTTAAQLIIPALHAVLSLEGRLLPSDPSDPTFSGIAAREAFRRSSLIFLASLKVKFGVASAELNRHLKDFQEISRIPHVDWTVVPELNLWAHAIVALEAEGEQRSWHVSVIVNMMEGAGFTSSQQAMDVVRGIIWIEALFVDKVESLCRDLDSLLAPRTVHQSSMIPIDPQLVDSFEHLQPRDPGMGHL